MRDYLDSFTSILPESQASRLLSSINVDEDLSGKTTEEYEQAIRELLAKLGKKHVTMIPRFQSGQTDSERYNQVLREIYRDLHNIYQESNMLDRVITNHHFLNISILSQVKKDIGRLKKQIESMNLLADNNEGYVAASHESFIDHSMWEPRETASEMYGNTPDAQRDSFENCITLGVTSRFNRIDENTKIEIIEQVGQGFRGNTQHSIDQAIDDNPESFWAEVILADEPLKVPMGGVDEGAVCRFKVTFSVPSTVSYLGFNPYTRFPLEIVSVGYTVDDSNDVAGYLLPLPTSNEERRLIRNETVYEFPAVTAKALIITVRQKHATKNTYRVSRESLNDKEMWEKIYQNEVDVTLDWKREDGDDNPQLDQKVVDEFDSNWAAYKMAVKRYNSNKTQATIAGVIGAAVGVLTGGTAAAALIAGYGTYDIFSVDTPKKVQRVSVDKYEYVYGMYDLVAEGREYNPSGVYISRLHRAPGNIMQVSLSSDEWHPTFKHADGQLIKKHTLNDPLRRTSIEYYVTYKDKPGIDDWFPILPLEQSRVNNELVVPENPQHPRFRTRFTPNLDYPIHVFQNERLLHKDAEWWFGDSPDEIMILPMIWDPTSKWTIDYTPAGNPYVVDFTNVGAVPTDITETFDGADKNGRIQLKHYPYIDYSRIDDLNYNPVKVELQGVIQGRRMSITTPIESVRDLGQAVINEWPAACLNVTNYKQNYLPELNAYNPRDPVIPHFEYVHEGRVLYLPESFRNDGSEKNFGITHGNAKVKVIYQYLVPGVRVKVVLRRTTDSDLSVTPKLNSYTIRFKTAQ